MLRFLLHHARDELYNYKYASNTSQGKPSRVHQLFLLELSCGRRLLLTIPPNHQLNKRQCPFIVHLCAKDRHSSPGPPSTTAPPSLQGLVPVLTSRPPAAARPRRSVARSAYDEAAKMFGEDFGARDPTRGEIETNFSDKVWFNWNTEHIIKPPESMKRVMGMSSKDCMPVEDLELLEESEIAKIKTQALGWRVEKEGAHFKLVQDFRASRTAEGCLSFSRFTL